ncbi:MAG: DNA replication priming helicase [Candidatus Tyloplasma litorale]|nr:MAG: DNA replication priming helicase [Mycoplasmatales bacterium]
MNKNFSLNSKYQSKMSFEEYSSMNDILVLYYLPLIRVNAFSLYLFLISESKNKLVKEEFIPIDRITSIMNLSISKIEAAIKNLEIINLLEVYFFQDHFIFNLKKPLTSKEFNSSKQMINMLSNKISNDDLMINNSKFSLTSNFEFEKFEKITSKIELTVSRDSELLNNYFNVSYDFDLVKKILKSRDVDLSKFWTIDLEKKLLDFVSINYINSFDLVIEIIKENQNKNFNINNLINNLEKNYKNKVNLIDLFDSNIRTKLDFLKKVTPKNFILYKKNRNLLNSEIEMILKLKTKYNLDDFKINILIDYSMIINDGIINNKYIYKIAETIVKENLDSSEKIVQHLKTSYKLKNNKNSKNNSNIKIERFE